MSDPTHQLPRRERGANPAALDPESLEAAVQGVLDAEGDPRSPAEFIGHVRAGAAFRRLAELLSADPLETAHALESDRNGRMLNQAVEHLAHDVGSRCAEDLIGRNVGILKGIIEQHAIMVAEGPLTQGRGTKQHFTTPLDLAALGVQGRELARLQERQAKQYAQAAAAR